MARTRASMYFAYGRSARPGLRSATTFEAVLAGERTSTTRFACWPGHARWAAARAGDEVEFFEDRAMRGRSVVVVLTEAPREVDLATCPDAEVAAWSEAEGWSVAAGRDLGRRHGPGLQLRYRLADGPAAR